MINHLKTNCKKSNQFLQDKGIAKFIRFLKRLGLKRMLSEINDPREEAKKTYSQSSLLLWALSVFFFVKDQKML